MLRVAVLGATGRMGTMLIRLIAADSDLALSGAATEPGHVRVGTDAGTAAGLEPLGVEISDQVEAVLDDAEVAIDFTLPVATDAHLAACLESGVPLVLGTTGLEPAQHERIVAAGERIPIVYGRNMSVGVNLMTELVRRAAQVLGPDFDVEIVDAHHREKRDAPSGTALQLGEAIAEVRAVRLADVAVYGRHGTSGPRPPGAIGFAALRSGSLVGDHRVMFGADEELVEIQHRALDRAVFARGALRAAHWLSGQAPGLYSMREVLGLQS